MTTASAGHQQFEVDRLCDEVRALLFAAEQDACSRRFVAAQRIAAIQGDARLGSAAVKSMAAKLGMGASSLFRYARVARRLSELEILNFAERARRSHAPFTWSHVETLATIREEGVRERLIQETLQARESVRDFARRVRAVTRTNARPSTSASGAVVTRLTKLRHEAERCAALLRDQRAALTEEERVAVGGELSALGVALGALQEAVSGAPSRSAGSPPLPFTPTIASLAPAQTAAFGVLASASQSIPLPRVPAAPPLPPSAPRPASTPQHVPLPFTPAHQPAPNPASLPPPWLNINP